MHEQTQLPPAEDTLVVGQTGAAVSRLLIERLSGRLELQLAVVIGVLQGLVVLARVTGAPFRLRWSAARLLRFAADQLDPPTGSEARH